MAGTITKLLRLMLVGAFVFLFGPVLLRGAHEVATYAPTLYVGDGGMLVTGYAEMPGSHLYIGRPNPGDAGTMQYGLWVNGSGRELMTSLFQADDQTRTMIWADHRGVYYGCLEALQLESGPVWRTFTGCATDTGHGGLTWTINAPLDINFPITATTLAAESGEFTASVLLGGTPLESDCSGTAAVCVPLRTYADAWGRSVQQYAHDTVGCFESQVTPSAVTLQSFADCGLGTGTIPMTVSPAATFSSTLTVSGVAALNGASTTVAGWLLVGAGGSEITVNPGTASYFASVINARGGIASDTGDLAVNDTVNVRDKFGCGTTAQAVTGTDAGVTITPSSCTLHGTCPNGVACAGGWSESGAAQGQTEYFKNIGTGNFTFADEAGVFQGSNPTVGPGDVLTVVYLNSEWTQTAFADN